MCEQIPGRLYNTPKYGTSYWPNFTSGKRFFCPHESAVSFRLSTVSVLVPLPCRPTAIYAADDFDIFYWMG